MILYLFKSILCLALLLAVYHYLLEKENMPRFNRGYLLGSLLLSLIIPLLPVGIAEQFLTWGAAESGTTTSLQPIEPTGEENGAAAVSQSGALASVSTMMLAGISIYIAITLFLLIRLICKVEHILHKVRRHARFYYQDSTVVLLKEQTAPFSFLGHIFLNEQEYNSGNISREVLIHENAHVRQRHSYDILFIEVLKALFWFNPLYSYCKQALQLNHEFLADQTVLKGTSRVKEYQKMLLKTLEGQQSAHLASSFNYSQIKKRMLMMNRKTPFIRSILKMSTALPLLMSAAVLFGNASAAGESDRQVIVIEISDSENIQLNNEEIHVSGLGEKLGNFSELPEKTISLRVHKNALFGVVLDVQNVMREHQILSFRYTSVDEDVPKYEEMIKSKIELISNEIVQISEQYMDLSVLNQKEEMERFYANILRQHNLLEDKLDTIRASHSFEVPPPPPLPPNPQQRVGSE